MHAYTHMEIQLPTHAWKKITQCTQNSINIKKNVNSMSLSENCPIVVTSLLIETIWKPPGSLPLLRDFLIELNVWSPSLQPIHDIHLSSLSKDAGRWKKSTEHLHFGAHLFFIYSSESMGQSSKKLACIVKLWSWSMFKNTNSWEMQGLWTCVWCSREKQREVAHFTLRWSPCRTECS